MLINQKVDFESSILRKPGRPPLFPSHRELVTKSTHFSFSAILLSLFPTGFRTIRSCQIIFRRIFFFSSIGLEEMNGHGGTSPAIPAGWARRTFGKLPATTLFKVFQYLQYLDDETERRYERNFLLLSTRGKEAHQPTSRCFSLIVIWLLPFSLGDSRERINRYIVVVVARSSRRLSRKETETYLKEVRPWLFSDVT